MIAARHCLATKIYHHRNDGVEKKCSNRRSFADGWHTNTEAQLTSNTPKLIDCLLLFQFPYFHFTGDGDWREIRSRLAGERGTEKLLLCLSVSLKKRVKKKNWKNFQKPLNCNISTDFSGNAPKKMGWVEKVTSLIGLSMAVLKVKSSSSSSSFGPHTQNAHFLIAA